ncbi:MAG: GntR family transcriptional regulator [Acidobacteria bacterium]|nr:GntR family transcriptional regulator [Acidobacteriota bacterium]MCI0719857.1 GntR family transcriptional regulator [Acidobacteriota bacterium]
MAKKGSRKGRSVFQAYEALRRKIITLELKPGEYLNEQELAGELAVGRTPLREAVSRLKAENLVVGQPNKSSYVKDLTLKWVRDLFEALVVVEKNANYLAAQRISRSHLERVKQCAVEIDQAIAQKNAWSIASHNYEFHRLIAESSDNELIYQIYQNVRNQSERLGYLAVSGSMTSVTDFDEYYRKISRQHQDLIKCLESRDQARILGVSVEHIKTFRERIIDYLSSSLGQPLDNQYIGGNHSPNEVTVRER